MNIDRTKRSFHPSQLVARLSATMLLVFAGTAMAVPGESGYTTITRVGLASNIGDRVFTRISTTPTAVTSCHVDSTWQFVLDISNDWGKHTYAMLLAAHASGRQIWLSGTDGVCLGDVQSVRSLTVYD